MAALATLEPKPVTHLYVQLTGDHRVSRSFRARWLLKNLMKTIDSPQVVADPSCEVNVLSALGGTLVTPATEAFFISQQYSLVFVLDMNAAMHCVSCTTYKVKLDEAVATLCLSLEQIAQPFHVPHSSVVLKPQLCVSVLGYSDIDTSKRVHVFLQGVYLHSGNCTQLAKGIMEKVTSVERQLAEVRSINDSSDADSFGQTSSNYDYGYGLGGMVTAGVLGLQLLPRNAIKGLILLTDGVSGFQSPGVMHAALNQMREANISCWVVQVGGPSDPSTSFGLVPDSEALQLMTDVCNGCLLDSDKMLKSAETAAATNGEANAIQRAVLYWTFQTSARKTNVRDLPCKELPTFEDKFWPNIVRDLNSYNITAPLSCIVGSRIREGFFLKDLIFKESLVELHLSFLWQACVIIEYVIITTWTNVDINGSLLVATRYSGPYTFVHDVHCHLNANISSSHRMAAVKKFTQTLKGFKLADTMLEHLLNLPSSPGHYTLPQSVLDGMPLFYLPPNQHKPVPSMGGDSEKGSKENALISFWCHLCSIDLTLWNKWFHSDKIILILGPDSVLPQNILDSSASSTGRFAVLLCQVATAKLYSVLKANSTFTLLEGTSYVRLLPTKENPLYFGLVRVAQKQPCVILHVGYIEGTPHSLQGQWFGSLYNALKALHVGGQPTQERSFSKRKHSCAMPLKGYICVLDKQLHKGMIRREAFNKGSREHSVQMDYMCHTSWNWCTPTKDSTILYAVLRRRLQEGFHITTAHNGYVTMTVEVGMQQPPNPAKYLALLQYVLFPVEHSVMTELWVEPQCGIVTDTPPGLDYLHGLEYQEITSKIHSIDCDVINVVTAFTYLWCCCRRGLPHVSLFTTASTCQPLILDVLGGTAIDHVQADPEALGGAQSEGGAQAKIHVETESEVQADVQSDVQLSSLPQDSHSLTELQLETELHTRKNCEVSFELTSLVKKSQVIAFSLVAFSEESCKEGRAMDLGDCSALNNLLHSQMVYHLQSLAPTEVPFPDAVPLMQRVAQSGVLEPFQRHCHISEGARYPWRCFCLGDKDSIFIFVVPCYLSQPKGLPQVIMPLLLLHCSKQMVLDPDPAELDPSTQPPDMYRPFLLCKDDGKEQASLVSQIDHLIVKLKNIYHSCYLYSLHMALKQSQTYTPDDFVLSMQVCSTTVVPVSCTALVGGVCPHTLLWQVGEQGVPIPVAANKLCQLLEGVAEVSHSSRWRVSLQSGNLPPGPAHCEDWGPEVKKALGKILTEEGFKAVPLNRDYYWFSEQEDQELGVAGVGALSPCLSPLPGGNESALFDAGNSLSVPGPFRPPDVPTPPSNLPTAPLFLHLAFRTVAEGEKHSTEQCDDTLPLCLKSLVTECKTRYMVLLDTMFVSYLPQVLVLSEEGEEERRGNDDRGKPSSDHSLFGLPACYHHVASSLKSKIEWLIIDELVAEAREVSLVTTPLIQAVVGHIQNSPPQRRCLCQRKSLRFVFGIKHCLDYFLTQLEGITVPGHIIKKTGDYFYVLPQKPTSPTGSTSDIRAHFLTLVDDAERSKTPPISHTSSFVAHRRTASCGNPSAHAGTPHTELHLSVEFETGYEMDDYKSLETNSKLPQFWLIFQFVSGETEVLDVGLFFHIRSSQTVSDAVWGQCTDLCVAVMQTIDQTCHRANQWFLLKDMLNTRRCSPLLLSELSSDAWVEEVVKQAPSVDHFNPQQFQCQLVWKRHIMPHWRLKVSKVQAALNITRTVLSAFSVTNRKDVYVLQDILENGEESIFYLRIDETLCQVDGDSVGLDESGKSDLPSDGNDAKPKADDSISMKSSSESQDLSHDTSRGKPQECLLLQLYGINMPSLALQDRLTRQIQWKLDDSTLEKLLSQYSRNQWLRLTLSDVHFLQPHNAEATHIFGITVPDWVEHVDVLFFYFLQALGSITLRPKYATTYRQGFFQVPKQLQDAYAASDLPSELEQDHLSLYIRPHVQGRGVAIICSSLLSRQGQVFIPEPRVIVPPGLSPAVKLPGDLVKLPDIREISLELPPTDSVTLCLHVWEKGNVGIGDLQKKLATTFQQALLDLILEMYLLPEPIAKTAPAPEEIGTGTHDIPVLLLQGQTSHHEEQSGRQSTEGGQDAKSNDMCDEEGKELEPPEHAQPWHHIEWQRRRDEEAQKKLKMAARGHLGTLVETYHTTIPQCLSFAYQLSSPSAIMLPYDLICCRSAHSFVAEAVLNIKETCPDAEIHGFKLSQSSHQFVHFYSETEARETRATYPGYQVGDTCNVVVCRNPVQWEESCDPGSCEARLGQVWIDPTTKQPLQLYLPLDSKKILKGSETPLHQVAVKRNVFLPRQRLILVTMECAVVKVWLYNVAEDKSTQLKNRLRQLADWHQARSGFLHSVLIQKMGLFQHTGGKDIQNCTKMAAKQCTSIRDAMLLVKNVAPLHNASTTQKPQLERQVSLEGFYMEQQPQEPAGQQTQDPVLNHGQQFNKMLSYQRKQYERKDLLERVFSSWHKKRALSSAPVPSSSISSVKRVARFLHYSTAPVLFLTSEDHEASSQFADGIKEEALNAYIEYLESLGFYPIVERPPAMAEKATPSKGASGKPHTAELSVPKFYKSLQKALTGGIIMIELMFQGGVFHIKMFTLEASRLNESPVLSVEVYGLFSTDCARFKDLIHLNSFIYDFHLRFLRELLKGTKPFPEHLDLRIFLETFLHHFQTIPSYIRNRLCKDTVQIAVSSSPTDLFQHILVHSGVYGARAQPLCATTTSSSPNEVALLIHVSPNSLGPTTSPQLHILLQNAQQKYSVRVLALMEPHPPEEHMVILQFYLMIVNKTELFPKLSPDAPPTGEQRYAYPTGGELEGADTRRRGGEDGESDLHFKVNSHRKKLGLSFLSSSPSMTPVMIDEDVMATQMRALGEHLKEIVQRAQSHLQRDALWKRLMYGKSKAETKLLEALSYKEFCMLSLQLATLCPLESLDQRLLGLKKQPRKWYKKLIRPIETKFGEDVRVFSNEESSYAAIINPDWPDMFVMIQADKEAHQQGIYAVYRKPQEGGVPLKERPISANVEGDRQHIETVVNFACSFLWANLVDSHFKS